jgi:AcrR family transcriptional regulator
VSTPQVPSSARRRGASGGGEVRRPGPKRRLTRERIVDEAVATIEADGLSALSMRRLAKGLGVSPGSLYTYVADRRELETLILDTVVERDGLPHELPGTWLAKLEAWARADWAHFRRSPWILELRLSVRGYGPAMMTWLDSALRVFDETGLPDELRLEMIDTLDSFVRGFATIAVQTRGDAPPLGTGETVVGSEEELRRAYENAPALQRVMASGPRPTRAHGFDLGLRCLLDGFRETAERHGGP